MKKILYSLIILPVTMVFVTGCEKFETPSGDLVVTKDKIAVGEDVVFKYDGAGDHIVFYSGESSHEYAQKDRHELEGTISVGFGHRNYNNDPNDLRGWMYLYYSTDYDKDKDNFSSATWTEITNYFNLDKSKWAYSSGFVLTGNVMVPEIKGQKVTFAFKAVAKQGQTPRWRWNNFEVKSYIDIFDRTVPIIKWNPTKGSDWPLFTPVNVLGDDVWEADGQGFQFWGDDAAGTDGKGGANKNDLLSGKAPEEDWLVFPTIDIGKTIYAGDTGEVKKTQGSSDTSWKHKYTKPGTYVATTVVTVYDSKKGKRLEKVIEKTITVE